MKFVEQAMVFPCAGDLLPGIVALPQPSPNTHGPARGSNRAALVVPGNRASDPDRAVTPDPSARCGVLIVVGGPQYRVGSHRQFLLLARRLAAEGYPTMRFDYRGMGDASGEMRGFEEVSADIGAALDAFQLACPSLRRIVLWGLCDAASAALLYVQKTRDQRVVGLSLLNPWVRSETSLAQTQIKHYYGQRLLQGDFWWKLLSGRMEVLNIRSRPGPNRTGSAPAKSGRQAAGTLLSGSHGRGLATVFRETTPDPQRRRLYSQGISRILGRQPRLVRSDRGGQGTPH